jgi:hypothetical protein
MGGFFNAAPQKTLPFEGIAEAIAMMVMCSALILLSGWPGTRHTIPHKKADRCWSHPLTNSSESLFPHSYPVDLWTHSDFAHFPEAMGLCDKK